VPRTSSLATNRERVRTFSNLLRRGQKSLRLRTKLILSFVLLTTALTCATLFIVRSNAQAQAQQHIEQDARNAALTLQAIQNQQQTALSRKADLLASVAFMRSGDTTAIEDAGSDPWQSEDCNLFVLADKNGVITALHSNGTPFPESVAQKMFWRSLSRNESSGWWSSGRNLYQIALQPFYEDQIRKQNLEGYVIVGHLVDETAVRDLQRMTASDVVLRYGDEVAVSTLSPLKDGELEKNLHGQAPGTQLELGGAQYYVNVVDLAPGKFPRTSMYVLKSYDEVTAYLVKLHRMLFGLGLITMLAGTALIFLISDTITRPVAALLKGVKALEKGDFAYALDAAGRDEVSTLTVAFDSMRVTLKKNEEQRQQLEDQLRQAQKMEALGRLAGGVAHDFNNLLTVIRGHSELLMDRVQPGNPLHNHSQQIRKTSDRAASLTRQLLVFSRRQVLQAKVLDLNTLVTDMGKLLRRLVREDIELNLQLGNSLAPLKADPGQLEQVILNLSVNASDAMPLGGKLTIETEDITISSGSSRLRPSMDPGNYILLTVTDTGHGMDAATKARIFEPFFTTKEPGKGTGLGLATVYGVVKQSGGFIWVESEPGRGTRFEIYFPRTEEKVEAATDESAKKSPNVLVRRKTVLVVEDEKDVRELASQFLTAAGYGVLTAQDGIEALEIIERLRDSVDAVLTDIVMPRMRGTELGLRLKKLLPGLKITYMTGYLDQNSGDNASLENSFFLQKPFSRENLVNLITQALNNELPQSPQPQPIPQTTLVQ
jgi:signal transduction histidine kinase/CheY-like chemotaxis protein